MTFCVQSEESSIKAGNIYQLHIYINVSLGNEGLTLEVCPSILEKSCVIRSLEKEVQCLMTIAPVKYSS